MTHSRTHCQQQFALLAPSRAAVSSVFRNVEHDPKRHGRLMAEMQRFRGGIYASDGAVRPDQLTPDGRHKTPLDEQSWHILALNEEGRVWACLRYTEETDAEEFNDLGIRHAALSRSPTLGRGFRNAVESEMARARRLRIGFGEVGGWAVSEAHRWTMDSLRSVFAIVGFLELLGGRIGVATATARHSSAGILRRIGLRPLQADGVELPSYYDPQYSCDMEVLRFDTRFPNPKYREWIDAMAACLSTSPVLCGAPAEASLPGFFGGFGTHAEMVPAA